MKMTCAWSCDAHCGKRLVKGDEGWHEYPDLPDGWTRVSRGWYRATLCGECVADRKTTKKEKRDGPS